MKTAFSDSNLPRLLITLALIGLVVWGLWLTTAHLSTPAVNDGKGDVLDAYQRASDTLHTLLPLLTVALGYWFGAAGRERAEGRADAAQSEADATKKQLGYVVGAAGRLELLEQAREVYPEASGPSRNPPAA